MIARLNFPDARSSDPLSMSSLLAFDTATEHMSIGLAVGDSSWIHEGVGGAQASVTLIPAIRELLSQAGATLAALDAIAFGRGPGAFTGLRTACSVAQGLAFGAGKPVICIDTLQAVAEDARSLHGATDVWVAMDARMDEIYAARYAFGSDGWSTLEAPALYALDTLNASFAAQRPLAVAGNALAVFGARLDTHAAQRIDSALPRAAALLAIARADWDAGRVVDAALALPLYVRDKVALTTIERDAVRAAKQVAKQAASDATLPQAGS
jgi:tRNA threonylcarbamoyladenosine biosynthesis protein TsaB